MMIQNNRPVLATTLLLVYSNVFAANGSSTIADTLTTAIENNKEQVALFAIGLFILVGLIAIILALRSFAKTRHFAKYGKKAIGKVIDQRTEHSAGSDGRIATLYAPKIRFHTDSGRLIEFTSSVADRGPNGPKYNIGSEVTVRYNPEDPSNARMDTFARMWLSTAILGFFGIMFLSVGLTSAYSEHILSQDMFDSVEARITNAFSKPQKVPVELFPEFVAAAPIPTWWNQVSVSDKIIHNYNELQAAWHSGTYIGPKLEQSARRMFKIGYLTILHNADNDFLVAETIERMKIISFDDQYPHVDTMLEFALNRYFYHNMPLDRCVNCMHGDTIANITRTLASNYDGENRYDDAIRIIDNLINKRGQEISDYKQADLYDIYAYALWRRGDKASAIATLKTSLAKWQNTINGRYLKRDLDRYTREFSKLQ